MTPLRQRMIAALQRSGKSERAHHFPLGTGESPARGNLVAIGGQALLGSEDKQRQARKRIKGLNAHAHLHVDN